jgi:hypothetical protein
MTTFFGYPATYVGLGGLFSPLRETHPFLFGIVATVTPFFIWVVFLWHTALNQIFEISKQKKAFLLSELIILSLLSGGFWRIFANFLFTILGQLKGL